jgi:CRISPR-associated exonuclease Cas4
MHLTPSHIIEYLYCPRFTFFEHVLKVPQNEDKLYKVQKGRDVHDQKLAQNRDYLRKRLGVTEKHLDQYLGNDMIRGQIDEVLELNDGTMAPLDYKFAQYKDKIFNTYKTQLYCYAWLIESNFGKKVNKGFLVYTRSKNLLKEVSIPDSAKQEVKECTEAIVAIIQNNHFPKPTKFKKRCLNCTYNNICVQ